MFRPCSSVSKRSSSRKAPRPPRTIQKSQKSVHCMILHAGIGDPCLYGASVEVHDKHRFERRFQILDFDFGVGGPVSLLDACGVPQSLL